MIDLNTIRNLAKPTPSKIILMVMDGLGGLPLPETGKTELETAYTPNLDKLAEQSICGLSNPISAGITPGSGPAHIALFGYNPLEYTVGRGILEACGINFELEKTDIACRGNFCTVDQNGLITDRRAGRLSTERNAELCRMLSKIDLDETQIFVVPVKEHRFAAVFRNPSLSADISDSDPQQAGVLPNKITPLSPIAHDTANIINSFISKAKTLLSDLHPSNMIVLRGFSKMPDFPQMGDVYKLRTAAIAVYPMYLGLAKIVGMKTFSCSDEEAEFSSLIEHYNEFDFFYIHFKESDSHGEDGNFDAKVMAIEKIDTMLPRLLELKPDVIVITGDHSSPALMKSHSWHPVPLLLCSRYCLPDHVKSFSETACARGGLGIISAVDIMPLALANALKLNKYGA